MKQNLNKLEKKVYDIVIEYLNKNNIYEIPFEFNYKGLKIFVHDYCGSAIGYTIHINKILILEIPMKITKQQDNELFNYLECAKNESYSRYKEEQINKIERCFEIW